MSLSTETLDIIHDELRNYEFVFTTNYDLILYWAMMHKDTATGFCDYFFKDFFDISNVDLWYPNITKVLYIHGGIHMYKSTHGFTVKRKKTRTKNLLELFGNKFDEGYEAIPLMVTEGHWKEKLNAIQRSDYLQFAYGVLKKENSNLVIYGHSLSEEDLHIYNALKDNVKVVAISIYDPDNDHEHIKQIKLRFNQLFSNAERYYFSSKSHPFGSDKLRIG